MRLPCKSVTLLIVGIFRHGDDPAGGQRGGLAVGEVAQDFDLVAAFLDPVLAGDAEIEEALGDVAAHFLRADEAARRVPGR